MLFCSLAFLLFLPIVFTLYWSLRSLRWQNRVIIAASFFFYGWWDWRFLLLMIATCIANYYIGIAIHKAGESCNKSESKRHPGYAWLLTAILINIGLLAVFKYFNFFADNLAMLFSLH